MPWLFYDCALASNSISIKVAFTRSFKSDMTQSAEHPKIVLASTSPYRKQQLEAWGLPFATAEPKVNESQLKSELKGTTPQEICQALAKAKAQSLAKQDPDLFVIGADQMAVTAEGEILEKPGDGERAVHQLMKLSGHTHSLYTALAVVYERQEFEHVEKVDITFRDLVEEEACAYVACDDPWDCTGAYKLEKRGICLVRQITGKDPSSIQGLPLMALSEAFLELTGHLPFVYRHKLLQIGGRPSST